MVGPAGGGNGSRPFVVSRRAWLRLGFLAGAAVLCSGHSPYRQWVRYRRQHLLILSDKTDPPSYPLSLAVAETLLTHLPASQARASRAINLDRLVSLITTGQMDVVLMRASDAAALAAGAPPLAGYHPVVLRVLAVFGDHLLVCRADFPDRHAYLVGQTIAENRAEITDKMPGFDAVVAIPDSLAFHDGVGAYRQGLPLPEPPIEADAEVQPDDGGQ
ncbi:MAG: hypothetical protein QF926_00795 [Alphaproteobacteria bacterium]|nr:hypothetical protein [Alphaproteobacteria bacterium]